tara:strand:- start:223 stop:501 length:279 start_codon:yes stop_codon:yes gene_type:complete
MKLSLHVQQRVQQRGMTRSDLDLILIHGTETRDGYLLRNQDAKRAEAELRRQIGHIHRLAGKFIVVKGETLVTAYHPTKRKEKNILRKRQVN